ncbi:MAG: phospho-sugar mutase [Spirochaetales bacterium]|nr:phospho-sugar mutase [Spirochaetales bacterium]
MEKQELVRRIKEYCRREEDPRFVKEIEELVREEAWDDLSDRFYRDLDFGTGGLRGVIGGGTNRMNPLTIRKASSGLARYVLDHGATNPKAVIAYDSRRYSELFAEETALTFCALGIRTYLFSAPRPTPMLSWAVRFLHCDTGVVVTASHNPPEYNGYKVYWNDGCQIVSPHDQGIIKEVRQVSGELPKMSKKEALEKGLLNLIDRTVDDPYFAMLKTYITRPEVIAAESSSVRIVYTPLHGTGAYPVERVFRELGIEILTVPEQREPDGDFPTVKYPNPEEASAMEMAVELGRKEKADLVMGTDPDADRFGIAVPHQGDFVLITGNQLGSLLCDYILRTKVEQGNMPKNPAVVKTIVTTELQRLIAESYGARCVDVLTGFKYIGEKMNQFEKSGDSYVFGGEESYGFLVETEIRDKDAVSAALMTAEMTLWNRSRNKSLLDHLYELYRKHGCFKEVLISKTFKGQKGLEDMKTLMEGLRKTPPESFGPQAVKVVRDYLHRKAWNTASGDQRDIDLPASDVLQFVLDNQAVVTVRPSGTEPKVKFYASCRTEPGLDPKEGLSKVSEMMEGIIQGLTALVPE